MSEAAAEHARVVLIGLNNTLSPRESDALVPWPPGCTGHRILQMIQRADETFTADDYLEAFERYNLWPGLELPRGRGKTKLLQREGRRLYNLCTSTPRVAVLLGTMVWASVLYARAVPSGQMRYVAQSSGGSMFYYCPHPSGRNRLLNDNGERQRAALMLLRAIERAKEIAR